MRRTSSRQSKTFIAKRRADAAIRIVFACIIIVIIFVSLWAFLSWSALQITAVQVSGADDEHLEVIHDLTMDRLAGSYLFVLPRANAYIYPRRAIRTDIQDLYQAVESVDVTRSDRHTLVVTVHEKKPSALICASLPDFDGDDISLQDPGSCYFADKDGVIFKRAPSFSGTIYDRYYMPDLAEHEIASSSILGLHATSTSEFKIISTVYDAIKNHGITVDAMLSKPFDEYELYLRNPGTSSSTVIVYFNTTLAVDEQVSNLISFWDHEVNSARAAGKGVMFDSIDVRYPPNVYHRISR